MKILHYVLGFPPARSGGLVGYTIDLMKEQLEYGHEVIALYPGKINIFKRRAYIKKDNQQVFNTYQIINSLPLPLFRGIKNPNDFMEPVSRQLYTEFLEKLSPQVIHVHTLMGIHLEFFESAKELKIPIVFTSHDYFGLAPEPNFFYKGKTYSDTNTVTDWVNASNEALETYKLRVLQLRCYPFIRKISNYKNFKPDLKGSVPKETELRRNYSDYEKLRLYYKKIFSLVDKYHFNSNLAKEVYEKNLKSKLDSKVITITNSKIKKRKLDKTESNRVRIAYIGPAKDYKGFCDFKELSNLMRNESNFEFHTYGYYPHNKIHKVNQHGKYSPEDLDTVYKNIDILVVPSKWKETFGLIVLEGISYNTEVFSSRNVGASELLGEENRFNSIKELRKKIINKEYKGFETREMKNMKIHVKEIIEFYREARIL